MLSLYNALLAPVRAGVSVWSLWAGRRRTEEWLERRARRTPGVPPDGVWIHGASVGEARLVSALAGALRERWPALPISVSACTRTGRAQLPTPPSVDAAFFLPLDFRGYPTRVLRALRPRALTLVETELWPNLLHEARSEGVPVIVVNGRLSSDRMSRYRRLASLYRPLLAGLARVGARSEADARRFLELGVPETSIVVTGSIKYDLPAPGLSEASLRRRFGLSPERPVVVAGSTGPGEDSIVLDAFLKARCDHPALFLVLAPRHPERVDEADRETASRGLRLLRLSSGRDADAGEHDGLLVDTIGELAGLYSLARGAFVGGSLVPVGGHNLLEPAAAAVPVLFGPHTDNVDDVARALLRAGAAVRVGGIDALAEAWSSLVDDATRRAAMGRSAEAVVRSNRGALALSVDLLAPFIGDPVGRATLARRVP